MNAHKCMHTFINTHIYVYLFFSLHIYISIYIRIHIIIYAQRKHTRVSISFSCRFPRQCRILLCTTYSVLCTTTLLRQSLPRHTHRLLCIVFLIYSKRILLRVSSECARILLLYIFNICSKRVYVVNGKFYRGKILFLCIVNEGNSKIILPN